MQPQLLSDICLLLRTSSLVTKLLSLKDVKLIGQSASAASLTEAVYYTAVSLCASILALCSCHGLFGLQVAVCGLKFFLLLRFFIIQLNDFQRG